MQAGTYSLHYWGFWKALSSRRHHQYKKFAKIPIQPTKETNKRWAITRYRDRHEIETKISTGDKAIPNGINIKKAEECEKLRKYQAR